MGSQLLLASTSSHVQLWRGSEKRHSMSAKGWATSSPQPPKSKLLLSVCLLKSGGLPMVRNLPWNTCVIFFLLNWHLHCLYCNPDYLVILFARINFSAFVHMIFAGSSWLMWYTKTLARYFTPHFPLTVYYVDVFRNEATCFLLDL